MPKKSVHIVVWWLLCQFPLHLHQGVRSGRIWNPGTQIFKLHVAPLWKSYKLFMKPKVMYRAMVIIHYQTQWLPTVVISWSMTWFLLVTWSPSMIWFHWVTLFSHWGCQMSISHELFDQFCVLAVRLILMCRAMIWPYGNCGQKVCHRILTYVYLFLWILGLLYSLSTLTHTLTSAFSYFLVMNDLILDLYFFGFFLMFLLHTALWISHTAYFTDWCHTSEWIMSHFFTRHVIRLNGSCYISQYGLSHLATIYFTNMNHVIKHTNKLWNTCGWVLSFILTILVRHFYDSFHTSEYVMSHIVIWHLSYLSFRMRRTPNKEWGVKSGYM